MTDKNRKGQAAVIALLLITSLFSMNQFLRQRADHDILNIGIFPYTLGDWKGIDLVIKEYEYKILETRNIIFREYVNPQKEKVGLFIIYSETNRSVFHPPEVCLIGSGAMINDKKNEKISSDNREFFASKLYLEKNENKEIALYCYKAGDFYTNNYYLQQALFAFNQLLGRQRGGATIRASMPLEQSEEATVATLKLFMKQAIETLESLPSN